MIDYEKCKARIRKTFAIFIGFFSIMFHIQQMPNANIYELVVLYPIGIFICLCGTWLIYKGWSFK